MCCTAEAASPPLATCSTAAWSQQNLGSLDPPASRAANKTLECREGDYKPNAPTIDEAGFPEGPNKAMAETFQRLARLMEKQGGAHLPWEGPDVAARGCSPVQLSGRCLRPVTGGWRGVQLAGSPLQCQAPPGGGVEVCAWQPQRSQLSAAVSSRGAPHCLEAWRCTRGQPQHWDPAGAGANTFGISSTKNVARIISEWPTKITDSKVFKAVKGVGASSQKKVGCARTPRLPTREPGRHAHPSPAAVAAGQPALCRPSCAPAGLLAPRPPPLPAQMDEFISDGTLKALKDADEEPVDAKQAIAQEKAGMNFAFTSASPTKAVFRER